MTIPQISMVILLALSLGVNLAEHGKPKTGKYNVIYPIISSAILLWILIEGGFFDKH
jgi:hypothetical protein